MSVTWEEYQAAVRGGFLDLRNRARFELRGPDRIRFLNGQITNSVNKATHDQAVYACALDAKGKLCGDLFFYACGDCLCMDTESGLRGPLESRLQKYLISDDAELVDVTGETALFHLLGRDLPELPVGVLAAPACMRIGIPGRDVVVRASDSEAAFHALAASLTPVADSAREVLRIEKGIARWGAELGPHSIPVEAGIAKRAIDYEKGCYLGQEVLSRIKSIGSPAKNLWHLHAADGGNLEAGAALHQGETAVGKVTSACHSFHFDKSIGLGYVKRGHAESGSALTAIHPGSPEPVRVILQTLP